MLDKLGPQLQQLRHLLLPHFLPHFVLLAKVQLHQVLHQLLDLCPRRAQQHPHQRAISSPSVAVLRLHFMKKRRVLASALPCRSLNLKQTRSTFASGQSARKVDEAYGLMRMRMASTAKQLRVYPLRDWTAVFAEDEPHVAANRQTSYKNQEMNSSPCPLCPLIWHSLG